MKIVLRSDVANLGQKGDLVEVAPGYARNYLVPRGLAIVATKGSVAQAEAMRRNRDTRQRQAREQALALAGKLNGRTFDVAAKAGGRGRLFGSVTTSDIAAAVSEAVGAAIDRRALDLADSVKTVGEYEVSAKLHPEIDATFRVNVVAR